ncbi:hypothetical protein RJZ56_002788 [Blastomyces dermatitidis]|uniref:Uncharacterized protein n=3 Tax=Blastomyces TaxID=229219 RepID=A0A179UNQ1_BLAGS|nr:uncharacterized protein BDBG_04459 [Blastomyces gilchristii SLH14081]XP_045273961.1 uncharacterized protein BDCG_01522 [Blastomyces dermatitidis ER-3]EGE84719.1 hypothetical protein BDDG_07664 [Blastomyces dermatitidis ATCC 18188]EQL30701.1 hypothetical protein BDFG_06849 [Blastomyces dermatitidis ATCC 26199]EEQ86402.1 hypothetical protein BDCG_01522 [Blastomyces dermatitidis ER-3]OAT08858.1 hypothetical protein BDBG_04459 [Blastomyces gilchristii SLH14081]
MPVFEYSDFCWDQFGKPSLPSPLTLPAPVRSLILSGDERRAKRMESGRMHGRGPIKLLIVVLMMIIMMVREGPGSMHDVRPLARYGPCQYSSYPSLRRPKKKRGSDADQRWLMRWHASQSE